MEEGKGGKVLGRRSHEAHVTVDWDSDPMMIVVETPAGEWPSFERLLKELGYRPRLARAAEGSYVFLTNSYGEMEAVLDITVRAGKYLTSGNTAAHEAAGVDVVRVCPETGVADCPADAAKGVPLLRDPDTEMPDDGFHIVAVTDDTEEEVVLAYHDAGAWRECDGDEVMDGSVVGWCWQQEAAEALRKAVRHG